jgi:hypothetical protein
VRPISVYANVHNSKTFLARLCEQAERYDEMVTYMKEVAKVRDAQNLCGGVGAGAGEIS